MKRHICFLLALLILLFPASVAAFADSTVYSDGYFDYMEENESITIVRYFGHETEVTVPQFIVGMPVNTIAAGAFSGTDVAVVYLPSSVTTVEDGAGGNAQIVFPTRSVPAQSEPAIPGVTENTDQNANEPAALTGSEPAVQPANEPAVLTGSEPAAQPANDGQSGQGSDEIVYIENSDTFYGSENNNTGGTATTSLTPNESVIALAQQSQENNVEYLDYDEDNEELNNRADIVVVTPDPTPTPKPTATPKPSATPAASAAPTSSASPAPASASPSPDKAEATPSASPSASPSPAPTAAPAETQHSSTGLIIAVVVIAVCAAAYIIIRKKGRAK